MTPDEARWLLSPDGTAALAATAALPLTDASHLADLERLRRAHGPARAAALLDVARARRAATTKFALADRLYFTRDALEQAGHEAVAAHLAARFAGLGTVVEVGCGAGGDTIALAGAAHRVVAVDRDHARLLLARANLAAHGRADRARLLCADADHYPPPAADGLFADPARRADGRRLLRPADLRPSLPTLDRWRRRAPAAAVKVAPGIADADVPPDAEIEFVAHGDDIKAAVLWYGPLRRAARTATLLPTAPPAVPAPPAAITAPAESSAPALTLARALGEDPAPIPQGHPAGWLYEPHPALIRAHLIDRVAAAIGAWQIDPTIAYLCAPAPLATPLARAWPVETWFPFGLKELRRRLRALGVGRVVIKKRGSPLDPQALAAQLDLAGPHARVVILTRVAGRPAIILCYPGAAGG